MRTGELWTKEEIDYLEVASKKGVPLDVISSKLKRTNAAISNRRSYLGIMTKHPRGWSQDELEMVMSLHKGGVPVDDIAKRINRTVPATRQRINITLRNKGKSKEKNKRQVRKTINKENCWISKKAKKIDKQFKIGSEYVVNAIGVGHLSSRERDRKIMKYLYSTDDLLVLEGDNYKETYRKIDVVMGQPSISQATKTDYQTIQ